jgi:hypothetical protein
MLFNSKLLLGFLLKQDIKDVEGVFSECKVEWSPSTQAPPSSREESPDLWIPRRKLWHCGWLVCVVVRRSWLVVVCIYHVLTWVDMAGNQNRKSKP